jgi:ActD protein
VGDRPLNSWPQFIPVTFETTVLGAALTAFIGMWALNRLPQPYHPVFNVEAFARASTDRFFLVIETADPRFERHATWKFLEGLHPVGVSEVAP